MTNIELACYREGMKSGLWFGFFCGAAVTVAGILVIYAIQR